MPSGCSAGYCTNSSKKGFQMCRFPKDLKRKEVWIRNINRTDWTPTTDARLCNIHFAPHMWMTRNDGSCKLKPDAVPTIFGTEHDISEDVLNQSMEITTAIEIEPDVSKDASYQNIEIMTEAAGTASNVVDSALNKIEGISSEEDITEEEKNYVFNIPSNEKGTSDPCVLQRLKRLEILWEKSERLRLRMKKKLRLAKIKIKRLEIQIQLSFDIHPTIKGIEFHPYK